MKQEASLDILSAKAKRPRHAFLIELFGWYGTLAILGAYILVSFSIIKSSSITYQLLNLTGSLGIVAVSFFKRVYQAVILNIIWAIIAVLAIINLLHVYKILY